MLIGKKLRDLKWIIAGLVFAMLWSSASTATKIALKVAQPLVIAEFRFAAAAFLMLLIVHIFLRKPLPSGKLWKQLMLYGLLNITIYLGVYIIAMQQVTASVGALTVAANPVLISFISVIFLKKPLGLHILLALIICMAGIVIVAWPMLHEATVTLTGLLLIIFSMLSYSIGTIYFSSQQWQGMHLLVINGWQTFFGGLFLLPFTFVSYKHGFNNYGFDFWLGTLWLAIPVSIIAVMIWLALLKRDAVKAGLWLFLCPIFGIIIAAIWVHDPLSWYTVIGVLFVLGGLGLSIFSARAAKKIDQPESHTIR